MVTPLSKLPSNSHADDILEKYEKNDDQKRKTGKGIKVTNDVNKHKINNAPTPMSPTHGLSFGKKVDNNCGVSYFILSIENSSFMIPNYLISHVFKLTKPLIWIIGS